MQFKQFGVHPLVLEGIDAQGFTEPTPVQVRVIPEALKRHDIRACAQTGTGKTVAFVIPILNYLLSHPHSHTLIMVPTRELGNQVFKVFQQLGKQMKVKCVLILGGTKINKQIRQIQQGTEVIVATPGRLLDHLNRKTLSLKGVDTLVLDEADRMLDMGFLPDIQRILSHLHGRHQTMLFSATFPLQIQKLVARFQKNPVTIDLAPSTPANTVTQMAYPVTNPQKEELLFSLLENANLTSAIIFCRTKRRTNRLTSTLKRIGKAVAAIHSDKSQSARNQAITGFGQKRVQLLIATDIASRGLDLKDVSHVINFDVPHHPEDYVHRIGRTGRAQARGDAFTLVSPDEEIHFSQIEKFIQKTIPRGVIPDFPYHAPPRLISKPHTKHPAPSHGQGHGHGHGKKKKKFRFRKRGHFKHRR
ncbi:hypothetical protein BVX98_04695 [bacterium F11]|nr:hypothetical protein BVX98_04695 [bacterium F11]